VAERQHVLATVRRVDAGGRLAPAAPHAPERVGGGGAGRPVESGGGQRLGEGAKRGAHTGPNPTDRAKKGCKRHVIGDASGIPLVVCTTPANVPDQQPLEAMVESMPPVKMPKGPPRYKPGALVGDRGYGFPYLIAVVVAMRIASLLSPRGKHQPHGSGLGRVRYVIERTLSWVGNYRRLKPCYERTGEHWQAFNELACCLICANRIARLRAQGKMAARS
jgi:hypothetical protein